MTESGQALTFSAALQYWDKNNSWVYTQRIVRLIKLFTIYASSTNLEEKMGKKKEPN